VTFEHHLAIPVGGAASLFGAMGFMPIFYLCFLFITNESARID
jgi:hypothetical protein